MRVLWVSAHPEPRSLTGALRREGIDALRAADHEVRESDLYAMHWNPVVDHADYDHDPAQRLNVLEHSEAAYRTGRLSPDIRAEQVVPPFVVNGTVGLGKDRFLEISGALRRRLLALPTTPALQFRSQDGGDYDEHLVLRPDRAPGTTGLSVHSYQSRMAPGRSAEVTET
jgi:hypothetical protein